MKFLILISLLLTVAIASASIKDARPDVKIRPELSQGKVSEQQRLQGTIGEVGVVPKRTDEAGMPRTVEDGNAGSIISRAEPRDREDDFSATVVMGAQEDILKQGTGSKRVALTFLWVLLATGLLVGGTIGWLNRFGPSPR